MSSAVGGEIRKNKQLNILNEFYSVCFLCGGGLLDKALKLKWHK